MELHNKKSTISKRIGEQKLIKDDLLLDWFPEGAKPAKIIYLDTATLNFMQRGNKSESYQN